MTNPNQGLEDINNLISLRMRKNNGEKEYLNYEVDLFTKANVYFSLNDYQQCNSFIDQILNSKTSTKLIRTKTLILSASLIQHTEQNYIKAYQVTQQALEIILNETNSSAKELKVILYHMIGEILSSSQYHQSIKIQKDDNKNNAQQMSQIISENKQKGKEYLEKAIQLIEDEMENNYLLTEKDKGQFMQRQANCYDSIAEIYHSEKNSEKCKEIMEKCIELWKSNTFKQPFQYANSLIKQGRIQIDRQEYNEAIEKLIRAQKLMQGYENTDQFIVLCVHLSRAHRFNAEQKLQQEEQLQSLKLSEEILEEGYQQIQNINQSQQNYYYGLITEEMIEVLLEQGRFEDTLEIINKYKQQQQQQQQQQIEEKNDKYMDYRILRQEIVTLVCQEKYNEIIIAVNHLLNICQNLYNDQSHEYADLLAVKGISLLHLKEYESAINIINQSGLILLQHGLIQELQVNWNQVVHILQEQQNYKYVVQALGYLKRSIQIFVQKEGGTPDLVYDFIDQQIQEAKNKIK